MSPIISFSLIWVVAVGRRGDARSTNLQSYGVRFFPYDADVPLVVRFAEFLVATDGQDALRVFYNAGRRTCPSSKDKKTTIKEIDGGGGTVPDGSKS